jgi:tetratricopeptide (TPR) repeat protein
MDKEKISYGIKTPTLSSMIDSVELLILEAKRAAVKGNQNRAKAIFRKVLKLQPENLDALISFGVLLNSSKKSAGQGVHFLTRAVKLDPSNGLAWAYLGESLITLEQYDKAEDCMRRAIKIDPQNARNWHRLANVLEKTDRLDDAVDTIMKSLEIDDTDETAWISLGRLYVALKKYDDAHEAYSHALHLDPQNQHIKSALQHLENLKGI